MAYAKVNNVTNAKIAKFINVTKADIGKINNVSAPAAAFANSYSVAKSIATGLGNTIRATIPADSPINFTQTDAFTISFWIKAGWDSSLNNSVFPFMMGPTDASTNWDNQIRIRYKENQNRILFRMLNNPGGGNYDITGEWLFHSNSGTYAAGYAAAGLGTTYWSAANRGYVGDDDFTMITIVKTTSTAGSALRLYWNANAAGAPPITGDTSAASMAMVSNEERELVIGSNTQPWHANPYYRAGNSTETQYNDFAIWDVALDADAVTAIYNSGTPIDLTSDSGNYDNSADLQLYYQFENNGTANTDADLSGTDYNITVSGDSNFESI
tara:strand:+ start:182 stop:1162 length:981 start_codon:yes stop_codon:yes gene_type:complete